jgi:hypothetical protein
VVDIERTALDREIPRLHDGGELVLVGDIAVQAVAVPDVVALYPASDLDTVEEADFCDVAQILGRRLCIDAVHFLRRGKRGYDRHQCTRKQSR